MLFDSDIQTLILNENFESQHDAVVCIQKRLHKDNDLAAQLVEIVMDDSCQSSVRALILDVLSGAKVPKLDIITYNIIHSFLDSSSLELQIAGIASATFLPSMFSKQLYPKIKTLSQTSNLRLKKAAEAFLKEIER